MSDLAAVLIACCLAMLAVGDNSTAIMAALPAMTNACASARRRLVASAPRRCRGIHHSRRRAADRFGARYSSTVGIGVLLSPHC
jgi:hypothetical protein